MPAELIKSISAAVSTVAQIRKWSEEIRDMEFKAYLADLSNQLADAKLEAANLKEEMAKLREERDGLRQQLAARESEKPSLKWGCYVFAGDETLYCPACYEDRNKKIPTTRQNIKTRQCPSCRAVFGR